MTTSTSTTILITARKRADISQPQLAAEMGISPRALWAFENERAALPRARTTDDYFAAITAICLRRASERQVAS